MLLLLSLLLLPTGATTRGQARDTAAATATGTATAAATATATATARGGKAVATAAEGPPEDCWKVRGGMEPVRTYESTVSTPK